MKNLSQLLLLLFLLPCFALAQAQTYGTVDLADLKETVCTFEKDANAVVLLDKTDVVIENSSTVITKLRRIKILSTKGLDEATVSIAYHSKGGYEKISAVAAHTVNLEGNQIKDTELDPANIYKQATDKISKSITFAFPEVRVGSVIEYTYKITLYLDGYFPGWNIQGHLPVKYCELKATVNRDYRYEAIEQVYDPFIIKTNVQDESSIGEIKGRKYCWALQNVSSFKDEPFATCREDNIEEINFIPVYINHPGQSIGIFFWGKSWDRIATRYFESENFGLQLNKKLADHDSIVYKAGRLSNNDQKTDFIFNQIKNTLKWNGERARFTEAGVKKAWEKKSGNSAEINLILYNFLTAAGVKCSPALVSTRDNGKVNTNYPDGGSFNTTVVIVTNSKGKTYALDATDKFNTSTNTPFDMLNCMALQLNPVTHENALKKLTDEELSREVVYTNARILPEGKIEGQVQISSYSYNKAIKLKEYNESGEKKYLANLINNDNNFKITAIKREDAHADSLPLIENIDFKLELNGTDENYIFISPGIFTSFQYNPFLAEKRFSPIDFGHNSSSIIAGVYKMPTGYKIEALPKEMILVMPDKSISFRRAITETDDLITIFYKIDFKRSVYTVDEYVSIKEFFKKMYEMVNEQIVLKKTK